MTTERRPKPRVTAEFEEQYDVYPGGAGDPHNLGRFLQAQADDYERALSEIRSGRKRSHWIWYIFPQFEGLGVSLTSQRYSIKSLAEAEEYLGHPVLGPRLVECAEAALHVEGLSALEIFGSPDDMKLRSCATLFACVSPADSVFHRLIEKYFQRQRDGNTLRLLDMARERLTCLPNTPMVNPDLHPGEGD